jgi:hypothetical protein
MWLGFAFGLFNAWSSLSRLDFYGWFRAIGIRSFYRMWEWSSRRHLSVMVSSELMAAMGVSVTSGSLTALMARGGDDLHGGQRADACEDESSFHHDRASRRRS